MSRDLETFAKDLDLLQAVGIRDMLRKVMVAASLRFTTEAKLRATGGPRARSGRLRASIAASVEPVSDGLELRGRAGGNSKGGAQVRYARMQEYGGVQRPRNAKMLAIPVGPALTGAGVSKFASPRDVPGLVLVRSRGGAFLLVKSGEGMSGRSKKIGEVWYVLKRQVTIPAQPYMRPAMQVVRVLLPDVLSKNVSQAVMGKGVSNGL